MNKKLYWFGLLMIAAACARGEIPEAPGAVLVTPSLQPAITAQPAENTLTPSPTLTILPSLTPTTAETAQPIDAITQPQPDPIPFDQAQPLPEDKNLSRGKAFIERIEPMDGSLSITGALPTPCHKLRVELTDPSFGQNLIKLSVYSLRDDSAICIQSLAPFQLDVPLNNIQDGSYTVTVNGVNQITFNWPLK